MAKRCKAILTTTSKAATTKQARIPNFRGAAGACTSQLLQFSNSKEAPAQEATEDATVTRASEGGCRRGHSSFI